MNQQILLRTERRVVRDCSYHLFVIESRIVIGPADGEGQTVLKREPGVLIEDRGDRRFFISVQEFSFSRAKDQAHALFFERLGLQIDDLGDERLRVRKTADSLVTLQNGEDEMICDIDRGVLEDAPSAS